MKSCRRRWWIALSGLALVAWGSWEVGLSTARAQGSLTPPGAPAPTMKTLQQVEPRQAINATGYQIRQPGSYYLTSNLVTKSTTPGVQVFTNDVTLDLDGFVILGSAATGNGVSIGTGCRNVLVRNGTIRDCYYHGLYAANASQCTFEGLRVLNNGRQSSTYDGLQAGKSARVVNCRVEGNRGEGVVVGAESEVSQCTVVSNLHGLVAAGNCRIAGNTVAGNTDDGISLTGSGSQVSGNVVRGNGDNYDLGDGNHLDLLLCEAGESLDWPCVARLAGHLDSNGHGVTVNASGVTLDLMGFTIEGDRGSADIGVNLRGFADDTLQNVVVRNGTVRNFGIGVQAQAGLDSQLDGLRVTSNLTCGVKLSASSTTRCSGITVAHCTISGNGEEGVRVYASSGLCRGNTIRDCTVRDNGEAGVEIYGYYGTCEGNAVMDCAISGNGSYGVDLVGSLGNCNGNVVANCTVSDNQDSGIRLYSTAGHCDGNRVSRCTLNGNGEHGVELYGYDGGCDGNTVVGCVVTDSGSSSISLSGLAGRCEGNTVADCTIRGNASRGLLLEEADGNRVEGNHVSAQPEGAAYGIRCVNGEGNLIVRNSCVGHTNNFSIGVNDTYGPIVTGSGALATTGAEAHPWANFSR